MPNQPIDTADFIEYLSSCGGTAFPFAMPTTNGQHHFPGITVRDYFAGQALAGMCSNGRLIPGQTILETDAFSDEAWTQLAAERAYWFADAMLVERSASEAGA